MGGRGDQPTVENRWWVDERKDAEGRPIERPPARFGKRFFRSGDGFEQARAQLRLTDSNLKWFEEANPAPGAWALLRLLPRERTADGRLRRVKGALRLPRGTRGVLVDSGTSLRAIATGEPVGERLVEIRIGQESSFDAWVLGEWVHEVLFRGLDDALRRAPGLLRRYLTTDVGAPIL